MTSLSVPEKPIRWEKAYAVIEPQIDDEGIHRWPFDPCFPIDIRFFVLGPRGGVRMNRHDYLEILYILEGEVKFQIQQRAVTARSGDLLVIGSTFFHRPMRSDVARAKAVALYFKPEILRTGEAVQEDLEFLVPFMAEDSNFSHVVPADCGVSAEVFNFMRRIHTQLPAESNRGRLTVRTFLRTILILLANHYSNLQLNVDAFHRRQGEIERLRPLFDLIDQSLGEVIAVKQAAACVHMSKSHFTRYFRRVTGQPFVTYLHHLRVAKAQTMLSTTDRTIAEIGQAVGFCDQSYFGLIFHKIAGRSPRQFRNESRSDKGKSAKVSNVRELAPPAVSLSRPQSDPRLVPSPLRSIRRSDDARSRVRG